jgi:hypothetical protein
MRAGEELVYSKAYTKISIPLVIFICQMREIKWKIKFRLSKFSQGMS